MYSYFLSSSSSSAYKKKILFFLTNVFLAISIIIIKEVAAAQFSLNLSASLASAVHPVVLTNLADARSYAYNTFVGPASSTNIPVVVSNISNCTARDAAGQYAHTGYAEWSFSVADTGIYLVTAHATFENTLHDSMWVFLSSSTIIAQHGPTLFRPRSAILGSTYSTASSSSSSSTTGELLLEAVGCYALNSTGTSSIRLQIRETGMIVESLKVRELARPNVAHILPLCDPNVGCNSSAETTSVRIFFSSEACVPINDFKYAAVYFNEFQCRNTIQSVVLNISEISSSTPAAILLEATPSIPSTTYSGGSGATPSPGGSSNSLTEHFTMDCSLPSLVLSPSTVPITVHVQWPKVPGIAARTYSFSPTFQQLESFSKAIAIAVAVPIGLAFIVSSLVHIYLRATRFIPEGGFPVAVCIIGIKRDFSFVQHTQHQLFLLQQQVHAKTIMQQVLAQHREKQQSQSQKKEMKTSGSRKKSNANNNNNDDDNHNIDSADLLHSIDLGADENDLLQAIASASAVAAAGLVASSSSPRLKQEQVNKKNKNNNNAATSSSPGRKRQRLISSPNNQQEENIEFDDDEDGSTTDLNASEILYDVNNMQYFGGSNSSPASEANNSSNRLNLDRYDSFNERNNNVAVVIGSGSSSPISSGSSSEVNKFAGVHDSQENFRLINNIKHFGSSSSSSNIYNNKPSSITKINKNQEGDGDDDDDQQQKPSSNSGSDDDDDRHQFARPPKNKIDPTNPSSGGSDNVADSSSSSGGHSSGALAHHRRDDSDSYGSSFEMFSPTPNRTLEHSKMKQDGGTRKTMAEYHSFDIQEEISEDGKQQEQNENEKEENNNNNSSSDDKKNENSEPSATNNLLKQKQQQQKQEERRQRQENDVSTYARALQASTRAIERVVQLVRTEIFRVGNCYEAQRLGDSVLLYGPDAESLLEVVQNVQRAVTHLQRIGIEKLKTSTTNSGGGGNNTNNNDDNNDNNRVDQEYATMINDTQKNGLLYLPEGGDDETLDPSISVSYGVHYGKDFESVHVGVALSGKDSGFHELYGDNIDRTLLFDAARITDSALRDQVLVSNIARDSLLRNQSRSMVQQLSHSHRIRSVKDAFNLYSLAPKKLSSSSDGSNTLHSNSNDNSGTNSPASKKSYGYRLGKFLKFFRGVDGEGDSDHDDHHHHHQQNKKNNDNKNPQQQIIHQYMGDAYIQQQQQMALHTSGLEAEGGVVSALERSMGLMSRVNVVLVKFHCEFLVDNIELLPQQQVTYMMAELMTVVEAVAAEHGATVECSFSGDFLISFNVEENLGQTGICQHWLGFCHRLVLLLVEPPPRVRQLPPYYDIDYAKYCPAAATSSFALKTSTSGGNTSNNSRDSNDNSIDSNSMSMSRSSSDRNDSMISQGTIDDECRVVADKTNIGRSEKNENKNKKKKPNKSGSLLSSSSSPPPQQVSSPASLLSSPSSATLSKTSKTKSSHSSSSNKKNSFTTKTPSSNAAAASTSSSHQQQQQKNSNDNNKKTGLLKYISFGVATGKASVRTAGLRLGTSSRGNFILSQDVTEIADSLERVHRSLCEYSGQVSLVAFPHTIEDQVRALPVERMWVGAIRCPRDSQIGVIVIPYVHPRTKILDEGVLLPPHEQQLRRLHQLQQKQQEEFTNFLNSSSSSFNERPHSDPESTPKNQQHQQQQQSNLIRSVTTTKQEFNDSDNNNSNDTSPHQSSSPPPQNREQQQHPVFTPVFSPCLSSSFPRAPLLPSPSSLSSAEQHRQRQHTRKVTQLIIVNCRSRINRAFRAFVLNEDKFDGTMMMSEVEGGKLLGCTTDTLHLLPYGAVPADILINEFSYSNIRSLIHDQQKQQKQQQKQEEEKEKEQQKEKQEEEKEKEKELLQQQLIARQERERQEQKEMEEEEEVKRQVFLVLKKQEQKRQKQQQKEKAKQQKQQQQKQQQQQQVERTTEENNNNTFSGSNQKKSSNRQQNIQKRRNQNNNNDNNNVNDDEDKEEGEEKENENEDVVFVDPLSLLPHQIQTANTTTAANDAAAAAASSLSTIPNKKQQQLNENKKEKNSNNNDIDDDDDDDNDNNDTCLYVNDVHFRKRNHHDSDGDMSDDLFEVAEKYPFSSAPEHQRYSFVEESKQQQNINYDNSNNIQIVAVNNNESSSANKRIRSNSKSEKKNISSPPPQRRQQQQQQEFFPQGNVLFTAKRTNVDDDDDDDEEEEEDSSNITSTSTSASSASPSAPKVIVVTEQTTGAAGMTVTGGGGNLENNNNSIIIQRRGLEPGNDEADGDNENHDLI